MPSLNSTTGTRATALIMATVAVMLANSISAQTPAARASAIDQALRQNAQQGFMKLLDEADRAWADVLTYKGIFYKNERRDGKRQPEEVINYKFMRDHCIKMEWLDKDNKDKKVLFVLGKYEDKLNIQVKMLFKIRLAKTPEDPDVRAKSNHSIRESGFGMSLFNIRKLTTALMGRGQVKIEYAGREAGPDGQSCFKLLRTFTGGTHLKKATIYFDEATLMPVQIEAFDAQGWLEKYTYKSVTLNPKLRNGRPELTVRDFYRSATFPNDRDWGKPPENWPMKQVAPKWISAGGKAP